MQTLISALNRLYLLDHQQYRARSSPGEQYSAAAELSPAMLTQHLRGEKTLGIELLTVDGLVRTLMMGFHWQPQADGSQRWEQLCVVANALQEQLSLPAPAVSISGDHGYGLWLSLETPVPVAQAQQFWRCCVK